MRASKEIPMKTADLVQRLSNGIESAVRSQHFCVTGTVAKIDPGIGESLLRLWDQDRPKVER